MPWTYHQADGTLYDPQGNAVASDAYSGAGVGRNNSAMEQMPNVGPIPRGTYQIEHSRHSPRTGPVSMNLTPQPGNQMFGRSAFMIHGDNRTHTASQGCIILRRDLREQIDRSDDKELTVQ
jgi:hypothetical protein